MEEDLLQFICAGPLISKLGMSDRSLASSIEKWKECGMHLCRFLLLDESRLTNSQKARIYHLYVPIFFWCDNQISRHRSQFRDEEEIPPVVVIIPCSTFFRRVFLSSSSSSSSSHEKFQIGFSGPQGCGKTSLVSALDYLLGLSGRSCASVSLDDFYLTADDQAILREKHPHNSLLHFRGNAGTHDLPLTIRTLNALKKLTRPGMKTKVPRYNKSAHGGRGDRADPFTWPDIEGPLMIVLFEGWMLGFEAIPIEDVGSELVDVNRYLRAYSRVWSEFVSSWIVIKTADLGFVFDWRLQAEMSSSSSGEAGRSGMSEEEVVDFIGRFMPAYAAYVCGGPDLVDTENLLVFEIDKGRLPIS